MGLTGTFEGYVPTATDIYNNGDNFGVLQNPSKTNNTVIFESGMFTFPRKNTFPAVLCTNKKWNLAGFSRINIDIDITDIYSTTPSLSYISIKTSDTIATDSSRLPGNGISNVNATLGRKTFSLGFTGLSYTKYLIFNFTEIGAKVYRVWLS